MKNLFYLIFFCALPLFAPTHVSADRSDSESLNNPVGPIIDGRTTIETLTTSTTEPVTTTTIESISTTSTINPVHTECLTNPVTKLGECRLVDGEGPNSCTSDDICNHRECIAGDCKYIEGRGPNQCDGKLRCNRCNLTNGTCEPHPPGIGDFGCDGSYPEQCYTCNDVTGRCEAGGRGKDLCKGHHDWCRHCDLKIGKCVPGHLDNPWLDNCNLDSECYTCNESNGTCEEKGGKVRCKGGQNDRCRHCDGLKCEVGSRNIGGKTYKCNDSNDCRICNLATGKCQQEPSPKSVNCNGDNECLTCAPNFACKVGGGGPVCPIAGMGTCKTCELYLDETGRQAMRCVPYRNGMEPLGNCATDGECNQIAKSIDPGVPNMSKYEPPKIPRIVFDRYFEPKRINRILFGKSGGIRGLFLGDPYCGPSRRALQELLTVINELQTGNQVNVQIALVGFPLGGSDDSIGNIHYQVCVEEITKRGGEYVQNFIKDTSSTELKERLTNSLDTLKLDDVTLEKVKHCVSSRKYQEEIASNFKDFSELGVKGTPTIVFDINDNLEEFVPWNAEDFRSYVTGK